MKVLVIGDFHGKFPNKLVNLIKKENIELVISLGDYLPFHYRKLWFKHCYGKEVELWEVIGKKKYNQLIKKDLKYGEEVLKKLNKLKVPVYTVLGNIDYPYIDDVGDLPTKLNRSMPGEIKEFLKILKKYKNIKRFDYSYFKFKDYIFIGMRGHSAFGDPSSKNYKKSKNKLSGLFKRFKKEKIIFVSHICPYNTKLDKIGKKADKIVMGTHRGSKLTRAIIQRHKPVLCLAGHFHENYGKDKLGKTILVNPGAVKENRAVVLDLNNKVKIKFYK